MLLRSNLAFIAVGVIIINPALADKPSYSDLKNVASALGSVAADFEACGEPEEADTIKYSFEAAIVGCVYKTINDGKLEIIFDTARSQRSLDIKEVGGSCKGKINDRATFVSRQIKKIENACDGKD